MVLRDDSQSSAVLQLLQQRFSTIELRSLFAQNRFPSIALFRADNNRGLAIGLTNDRPNQVGSGTLFPGMGNPASRDTLGSDGEAEALQSLTTPEPTTYAILGAAIGGMLLLRRRKR